MSWKEGLQEASYKGVPFAWLAQTGKAGRRLAEHEYPQRDQPYIEDMGRITRPFVFEAVIGGPSWQDDLNALLTVLEEPGAGELVHPLYGTLTVYPRPCEWKLDLNEGGVVRLSLEFIEAGQLAYPVASTNSAAQVETAAEAQQEGAQSAFAEAAGVVQRGRAQVGEVVAELERQFAPVQAAVGEVTAALGGVSALVQEVLALPDTALGMVLDQFDVLRGSVTSLTDLSRYAVARGAAARLMAYFRADPANRPTATPSQQVATALGDWVQQALAVDGARAAAELPVASVPERPPVVAALDPAAGETAVAVPVASDVAAAREAITAALWQLALEASPARYPRLQALRQATHAHLLAVERAGRRVVEWTPPEVLPAVVAAYRAHGDARLADELVARNRVRHPLFVPVQPLKIPR